MKKNPESGYWKIGPVYVKKAVLLTVLAAGAIAAIGYFGLPTELLEKPPGETVYRFDDPALKDLSEFVRICDETGAIRYEGPVEKGVCTGSGRVYDETGALIYEGPLVEGRYHGEEGRLYEDGKLVYHGGFRDGLYEGPGTRFDYEEKQILQAWFLEGKPDGTCQSYDLNWNLGESLDFINGELRPPFIPPLLGGSNIHSQTEQEGSPPTVGADFDPTPSENTDPTVSENTDQTDSGNSDSILEQLKNGIFYLLLNLLD